MHYASCLALSAFSGIIALAAGATLARSCRLFVGLVLFCRMSTFLKKYMRFCYFCRSWIKINIIFGLICKKKCRRHNFGGFPNHTIRLLWKFDFIVSRYFLEKHVHNRGSGFEYVEKILIFYTSVE